MKYFNRLRIDFSESYFGDLNVDSLDSNDSVLDYYLDD